MAGSPRVCWIVCGAIQVGCDGAEPTGPVQDEEEAVEAPIVGRGVAAVLPPVDMWAATT